MRNAIRNIIIVAFLVVAVGSFVKRGRGPAVPLAVSATVDHFAKGLVLGEPISMSAAKVAGARWQPNAGYVGSAPGAAFTQAVLLPSLEERAKATPNGKARLQAIELTAAGSHNMVNTLSDLAIAFRGVPKQGCISLSNGESRLVQYWIGQQDAGGVAVISDMGNMQGDTARATGAWSLFAWAGPFKGSETLAAAFDARPCDGTPRGTSTSTVVATARTMEALSLAFRDSIRGFVAAVEATDYANRRNTDAPNACEVPVTGSPTTRLTVHTFSIELPSDFVVLDQAKWDAEAVRSGSSRYEFVGSDGSTVSVESINPRERHRGGLGLISSECDAVILERKAHFDVGNASVAVPKLTVGAAYDSYPHATLSFVGVAKTQERQRELLAAAYSIRLTSNWERPGGE
ncbi:MAG TPA: hypothetical protein VFO55_01175 [Gemmatimonadaceae bacterium]|nr:hypothetical protein [Gemmatimonadaceae bacterium]